MSCTTNKYVQRGKQKHMSDTRRMYIYITKYIYVWAPICCRRIYIRKTTKHISVYTSTIYIHIHLKDDKRDFTIYLIFLFKSKVVIYISVRWCACATYDLFEFIPRVLYYIFYKVTRYSLTRRRDVCMSVHKMRERIIYTQ